MDIILCLRALTDDFAMDIVINLTSSASNPKDLRTCPIWGLGGILSSGDEADLHGRPSYKAPCLKKDTELRVEALAFSDVVGAIWQKLGTVWID